MAKTMKDERLRYVRLDLSAKGAKSPEETAIALFTEKNQDAIVCRYGLLCK